MKHFAVTITRTCGAGGTSIAKILSAHYGIEYYDRMLLRLAAGNSGINEAVFAAADEDTKKSPLFNAFKKVYNGEHILPEKSEYATSDDLFAYQAKVMKELIKENSFIVIGRGGDYVLKDYDNVVNIFVCGDMESKIHRMMWTFSLEKEVAEERIRETDKQRHKYYNYYTGKTWDAASNYDLCLNTGDMTIEEAAEQIKLYLKQKGLMEES